MRRIVDIPFESLSVNVDEVLALQGYPPGVRPGARVESILADAIDELARSCEPRGVAEAVSRETFREIYEGNGLNETETPVADVFPLADHLVLFAVTLGEAVSKRIDDLFAAQNFPLGSMLDSAASDATERAGGYLETEVLEALRRSGKADGATRLLRYSPGYCGWHMSGQGALFAALRPGEIGIKLGESFLMQPLKSMTGVILGGSARIHDFEMRYPFCARCATIGCRERIRRVMEFS
jgi:hypothetical protein